MSAFVDEKIQDLSGQYKHPTVSLTVRTYRDMEEMMSRKMPLHRISDRLVNVCQSASQNWSTLD